MSLRSSIEHYRTLRQAPIWKLLASDNGPQAIAQMCYNERVSLGALSCLVVAPLLTVSN